MMLRFRQSARSFLGPFKAPPLVPPLPTTPESHTGVVATAAAVARRRLPATAAWAGRKSSLWSERVMLHTKPASSCQRLHMHMHSHEQRQHLCTSASTSAPQLEPRVALQEKGPLGDLTYTPSSLRIATFNVLAPCYKALPTYDSDTGGFVTNRDMRRLRNFGANRTLMESDIPQLYKARHERILNLLDHYKPLDIIALQEYWFHEDMRAIYEEHFADEYKCHSLPRQHGREDGVVVFVRKHLRTKNIRRVSFDDKGNRVALLLHLQIPPPPTSLPPTPPLPPLTKLGDELHAATQPSAKGENQRERAPHVEEEAAPQPHPHAIPEETSYVSDAAQGSMPTSCEAQLRTSNTAAEGGHATTKRSVPSGSFSSESGDALFRSRTERAPVSSSPPPEQRLEATEAGDGSLDVIFATTHFTFPHSELEHIARLNQAKRLSLELNDFASTYGVNNVVVTGDFNGNLNSGACRHLQSNGYESVYNLVHHDAQLVTHKTHKGDEVGVDFVFLRSRDGSLGAQEAFTAPRHLRQDQWPEEFSLSDHRPIVVQLQQLP